MRAITLLGGLVGSGVLLAALSTAASVAALGVVLVVIGVLAVGLVSTAPGWLKVVVGLGAMLLVASVGLAVESEIGGSRLSLVVGAVGVLFFGVALVTTGVRRHSAPGDAETEAPAATGPRRGETVTDTESTTETAALTNAASAHVTTVRDTVEVPRVVPPQPRVSPESSTLVPAPRNAERETPARPRSHRASRRGRRAARGSHAR